MMTSSNLNKLLDSLADVQEKGDGQWQARCPAHDDNRASLSVSTTNGDGKIGVYCHANCATKDVMAAVGMKMSDLMPQSSNGKPASGKGKIVATYDYREFDGSLLFQAVRFEPKDFRQRRPKDGGGWEWKVQGTTIVPYRCPELAAADPSQVVFIVEGEKDVDRLRSLGLVATCNAGGAGKWKPAHSQYLSGRSVVILPDNDQAGRKHANEVARLLARFSASTKIVPLPDLPDKGDVSDWLDKGGTADTLLGLVEACAEWAPEVTEPKASKTKKQNGDDDEDKSSTADKLVDLALQRYRIGRTDTDDAFAVEIDGPNVALMFRGSRDALRSALARAYRLDHGRVPNSTALADALTALQGEAYAVEPEPVYLRVAEHNGNIVVDLGDASGRAVVISPGEWQVVDHSPVLFRRTAATGVLPVPVRGGSVDELKALLNVTPETWLLAIAWQVAAFVPNMPHPILLLGGQQGTGKTTAARKLVGVIDPSPADLRSHPRDVETWAISAAGSWVVAVDNVSTIPDWWSDSLCKAVTGDGWLRRKLYTDGELAVLSFRRVILLTSIDPGALRGDLGDRVLLVDLEPIKETGRRAERDIDAEYEAARPRILGALFDLLAKVWKELPTVQLDRLPRMADFGRLLAAMDRVKIGGDHDDECDEPSLNIYLGQRGRIAETVIESDQVALAIQSLLDAPKAGSWEGTAAELLEKITPEKPPKDWPRTPQSLGGRLKRLTPALGQSGIVVTHLPRSGKRKVLTLTREVAQTLVIPVTPVTNPENKSVLSDDVVTSGDECDQTPDPLVTPETSTFLEENSSCDQSDECDEQLQPLSSWSEV